MTSSPNDVVPLTVHGGLRVTALA
ncbi:MAG: hypothetical protein QOF57_2827, partial [Frankiaceae bacterium]|nr:hypothetical protein [Frankiaceae bacterium]